MPRSFSHNSLPVSLFLSMAVAFSAAQTQMASLHPNNALVWQRSSPTPQKLDGPVLYQLLFSTAGTPNTIAKFDTNPRHLTASQITDDGTTVTIGGSSGLVVNASGKVLTFNSVSLLGGGWRWPDLRHDRLNPHRPWDGWNATGHRHQRSGECADCQWGSHIQ